MLKNSEETQAADTPELGRLLVRLMQESRDWAEAEARLARIELSVLRAQAVRMAALAAAAAAALLCMMLALTEAMIAALKHVVAGEGLAALIVAIGFAAVGVLCSVLARHSLAWRTESLFFRWFGSRNDRSGR